MRFNMINSKTHATCFNRGRSTLLTFTACTVADQGHLQDGLLRRWVDVVEPEAVNGDVRRLARRGVNVVRIKMS